MFSLEQLEKDFQKLTQQKEAAFNAFHQCLGAIGVVQSMINQIKNLTHDSQSIPQQEEQTANEQANDEAAQ